MPKKSLILAGVAVIIAGGIAFMFSNFATPCTAEEYTKKATEIQGKIVSLQQKDPKTFQEAMTKMQALGQKMTQNPTDLESACKDLEEISKIVNK